MRAYSRAYVGMVRFQLCVEVSYKNELVSSWDGGNPAPGGRPNLFSVTEQQCNGIFSGLLVALLVRIPGVLVEIKNIHWGLSS